MNKKRVLLVGTILVIVIISAIIVFFVLPGLKDNIKPKASQSKTKTKTACQLFSLTDAKKVIGEKVAQYPTDEEQEVGTEASTKIKNAPKVKTIVTTCTYSKDGKNIPDALKPDKTQPSKPAPEITTNKVPTKKEPLSTPTTQGGASVSLPPTDQSIQSNPIVITLRSSSSSQAKKDFMAVRMLSYEKISGLGEDAYWRTGKDFSGAQYGQMTVLHKNNLLLTSGSTEDLELSKMIINIMIARL